VERTTASCWARCWPLEWYDRHNIRLIDRTRVTKLDTLRKLVETADGKVRSYDVAVLATGSQPVVPALEGMNDEHGELKPGIFVYRTIGDCMRMRERVRSGDSAIVVGGGLLGLEAAKVLSDRGLHVTVVQLKKTLMNAQLDEIGGEMLERQIERSGIFVRTGRTVEAVYAEEAVKGVFLDDGTTRPADIVVLACGVRPRIDVAKVSGLPVNRGIIVNDTLATEVPSVYAFGECAEPPFWPTSSPATTLACATAAPSCTRASRSQAWTSPPWASAKPSAKRTKSCRSCKIARTPTAS
jgi:nitrite reductase (NADH) large subunit